MRHSRRWLAMASAFVSILSFVGTAQALDTSDAIRALAAARRHPDLTWAGLDDVRTDIEKVYAGTAYTPLWVKNGRPTAQARAIVVYIASCDTRGLRPADYDAALLQREVQALAASGVDAERVGRFDTAMTIALLRLLRHTAHGRVDPQHVGFGLDTEREALDLQPVVLDIAGSSDPGHEIDAFGPPFPLFQRLLTVLAAYRRLAERDDVPKIADIRTLHPGESSPATGALRARLIALGDLPADTPPVADETLYDGVVVDAVKRFQHRHGLDDDGVIGPATLRALQVPISARVSQIELAIERLRWLPRQTPDRFIIVNIPEFRLLGFERGQEGPVMTSEVVVGSAARKHETPILHSEMQYLVFRPYWNVPPSIARKELLPKERAKPGYLARNNMELVDGRLRQRPGSDNSLGLVKFIFPNRHHVYLHDTPAKALFGRSRRDFSHGCIRVGRPADLAEFVLRGQDSWNQEKITAAMQNGRDNQHVRLDRPVAIYLIYSTVIVGRSGELRFFEDIYGHDAELREALAKGPPYS